jgi:hypothetical protein
VITTPFARSKKSAWGINGKRAGKTLLGYLVACLDEERRLEGP